MNPVKLRIWHSPDNDDLFCFWALREGLLSSPNLEFKFHEADTEELNRLALETQADVVAVSAALIPRISSKYFVLSTGASIGRSYGPRLVSNAPLTFSALNNPEVVIGIPGELTTARAILKLALPKAKTTVIPIKPYSEVFKRIQAGDVAAAVLIHEGQILFERHGLHSLLDLGAFWSEQTGLALPLGVNVIRNDLPQSVIEEFVKLSRQSIEYALENRDAGIDFLESINRGRGIDNFSRAEISKYLSLYANEDSLAFLPENVKALNYLQRLIDPQATDAVIV